MKNTEYRFFFKIKTQVLYGGSIRACHEKAELFFHYPYGSIVKCEVEAVGTGIIDDGYINIIPDKKGRDLRQKITMSGNRRVVELKKACNVLIYNTNTDFLSTLYG
jgi:hypothetical protein